MKPYVWLGLIFVLLIVGCGGGGQKDQGLILYQVLDEESQLPASELAVTDVEGKELRRISLSDTVQRSFVMPSDHRALIHTADDKMYLVDAEQGSAQELDLPEEAHGKVFPSANNFRLDGGKQWELLGDATGKQLYLVNLETGQVYDLMESIAENSFVFSASFTPDDEYVLLGPGPLWLVPTENPGMTRRLGKEKTAHGARFSSDGKQIAYIQRSDEGGMEVVIEQVDGSQSEVVATGTGLDTIEFVPGEKQLVIVRPEYELSLLSLDSGQEKELLTLTERPERMWFAPNGERLFFTSELEESWAWYSVNLEKGSVQGLDSLDGHYAFYQDKTHRWLFLSDEIRFGARGAHFASLDLESGETRTVLALDEETSFMSWPAVSSDGRLALVNAQTADKTWQLWLLQADSGESRLLLESDGSVRGALSPDGRWVAVGVFRSTGEQREVELTLLDTQSDESRVLGEGFAPIWVKP